MKPIIRVLEDYDSGKDMHLVLDKPWFTRPTKLTDGYNTIEVMFNNSVLDCHWYNIRNMGPYKFQWLCGTALTEARNDINIGLYNTSFSIDYVGEKYKYGGCVESLIEQEVIKKTELKVEIQQWFDDYLSNKPLYLDEDLVPSQFYGLNDYLKVTI